MTITPKNWNPDPKWFGTILKCEDEYGKMMRIALYVEDEIDKLIKSHQIISDKKFEGNNTTFYNKVMLLRALRIRKAICDDLEIINKIRNEFAHEKYKEFKNSESRIKNLIQNPSFQFSANDGPLYEWNLIHVDTILKKTTTRKIKDMQLGDQLAVISSMLSAAIYLEQ